MRKVTGRWEKARPGSDKGTVKIWGSLEGVSLQTEGPERGHFKGVSP